MPEIFMPVDNTLENIPMIGFVIVPLFILTGLLTMILFKKSKGEIVPATLTFTFIGMLLFNFSYHNINDLMINTDYARFKEGSIFGYIGALVGLGVGFMLNRKGMGGIKTI
jgi:tryptophan-rich sensory protein